MAALEDQAREERIAAGIAELRLREGYVRDLLEAAEKRLATIEDNSRLVLSAVGVFAVVFSVAGWKTLDLERKSTKQRFDDQLQHIQDSRTTLLSDFPMFGRMRSNFTRLLQDLAAACQPIADTHPGIMPDDAYKELSWQNKQSIYFVESAMANSMLLDLRDQTTKVCEIYRLLGIFYASKFTFESQSNGMANSRQPLERGWFYFDKAIELEPANYDSHWTAGYFSIWYEDQEACERALVYLKDAAILDKSKQRPLIAKANIELRRYRNPAAALATLREAAARDDYTDGKPATLLLAYLQSCAEALYGDQCTDANQKHKAYDRSLANLELVADAWEQTPRPPEADWVVQWYQTGDGVQIKAEKDEYFVTLRSHPTLAMRLDSIESRFKN